MLGAVVPGWRPAPLPYPWRVRATLAASFGLARILAWLWFRRPLARAAPDLLARMAAHPWWPFRALVQWWKLVALLTAP